MTKFDKKFKEFYGSEIRIGNPVVHVKVLVNNFYYSYKEHEMIIPMDMLRNVVDYYNIHSKRKNFYKNRFYNELMNLIFRPHVVPDDFCLAILKYISSLPDIQQRLNSVPQGDCKLLLRIDVENIKSCKMFLFTPEDSGYNFAPLCFDDILESKTGISFSFKTTIGFLSLGEMACLFKLVKLIRNSGKNILKITESELADLWGELLHQTVNLDDSWVNEFLSVFSSLNLINLKNNEGNIESEDEEPYFIISINNIEYFNDYYTNGRTSLFA